MPSAVQPTRPVTFERERGVYDVRVTRDVAHAVVVVGDDPGRTERFLAVFKALADQSIPVFLIKLHRTAITFAVSGDQLANVESGLQGIAESCRTRRDLALISVVASSMRDLTGVMVDIADSIQRAGARLYGVGDSHNSVQCLIEESHLDAAVAELSRTFALIR